MQFTRSIMEALARSANTKVIRGNGAEFWLNPGWWCTEQSTGLKIYWAVSVWLALAVGRCPGYCSAVCEGLTYCGKDGTLSSSQSYTFNRGLRPQSLFNTPDKYWDLQCVPQSWPCSLPAAFLNKLNKGQITFTCRETVQGKNVYFIQTLNWFHTSLVQKQFIIKTKF